MLWLAVATPDIPEAVTLLQDLEQKELARVDPDGTAARAAEHVIDLDAATSTCPACMGEIPRGKLRCPHCGLRLG